MAHNIFQFFNSVFDRLKNPKIFLYIVNIILFAGILIVVGGLFVFVWTVLFDGREYGSAFNYVPALGLILYGILAIGLAHVLLLVAKIEANTRRDE